jgi:large subunit ribosomal protein L35
MIKIKTKKAAAKRYKVTGTGKIVARKAGLRHLLTHKSRKRKRSLGADFEVSDTRVKSIKKILQAY